MTLSKKDYEAIAKAISKSVIPYQDGEINKFDLVTNLGLLFKADNPNFIRAKFKEACYK